MADNVSVTQGSGTTMATDLIGSVHHPRIKIQTGEDGVANDVSSTNPMPVSLSGVSTSANQDTTNTRIGSLTETAPANDTASSGLNGRLQRIAQRLTSLIGLLPPSIGQKLKIQSFPVTLASDQVVDVKLKAASSGFISVLTNTTGTQEVQLSATSIPCTSVTVQNSTGVAIELRNVVYNDFNTDVFYIPTGSFVTVRGITDVNQLTVRRFDVQNIQVRVTAYWEN